MIGVLIAIGVVLALTFLAGYVIERMGADEEPPKDEHEKGLLP